MMFRNRWHNLTPGIARNYRFPARISYTNLFETACRNAFQWRWPGVILTCLPPPRPSGMGDFRLYGRPVSQTISSLSVRSNCVKIILLTKHILHVVLQCLSFTVAWAQSSLWSIYASYEVFFPARVGKGLVVFPYCFHTLTLIGYPVCSPWSDTTVLYPLFLPLWQLLSPLLKSSLWYQEWWNLHSPPKRIAYTFKWSNGILDTRKMDARFRPWYLWKQDLDAKCLP